MSFYITKFRSLLWPCANSEENEQNWREVIILNDTV